MTSRRLISDEKTYLDTDDDKDSSQPSNIAPAVPAAVIWKLLGFTFAMITMPIGTYFLTVNTVFKGNSTFAGALAAIIANVVLVGYVVVAMREDQSERLAEEEKQKKAL
ncbi:vacuolar ATPase assembly integral membrane protein VMA21 [Mytilinidion resinicola]|uniref:Vacuolar ATPase assembly integral membrane protein VMA21 n=1 Tax=Mytilinidion resinicola TaxID=574789 RepID=A0A6A6YBP4_9PEZI|nr:vacuolar ATPase assembly integral membrane protein VMA21 [Mytilinidion resinicola]KAF2805933.1 vacuolar ATPase assembly integral membrane protein VMA21 [Mytilinidion resinicola]